MYVTRPDADASTGSPSFPRMSTPLFDPLEKPARTRPEAGHIQSTLSDWAAVFGAAEASTFGSGGDRRNNSARFSSEYGSLIALGPVLRRSGRAPSAAARGSTVARGGSAAAR